MFKSKHSGWTWDLKRTPFGGSNPISSVTDAFSGAIGTDGSGGGLLGGLADIDPGAAIGQGLAEVDPSAAISQGLAEADTFVNREIPGGWKLPAAIAIAYATGYIDPSLFATEAAAAAGAEAGAGAIATEAGQTAFFEALANGATSTEAVGAGLSADALATGATVAGSTEAALAGPTYGELGVTGVEGGMAGPTYGELGYTGLNQSQAIAAADAAAQSGLSASDVLTNANRLKNIAKLLTGSEQTPIYGKSAPTASQWATQAAQNFAQATPEQFGGLYQMNKNPFTFANPLASALKGNTSGLDVSGTGGTTLQSQNLAKLLA
jgi:hypothetical protein